MKSLVIGNWKMNPATYGQAKLLFDATRRAAEKAKSVSVVVAPPSIFLRELRNSYKGKRVSFAVQNGNAEPAGAYTGEISFAQSKNAGAAYAIIGHAERRGMGETNDDTRKKVAAALSLKITPVLCVGEKERTSDGGHFNIVGEQLRAGFADVQPPQVSRVVVAYEPLWAIGGSKTMGPRDMHEMAIFIRKTLVEARGQGGMNMKILYGGSVDETNAGEMLVLGDVHGLLVGRASEDGAKFAALLQSLEQVA